MGLISTWMPDLATSKYSRETVWEERHVVGGLRRRSLLDQELVRYLSPKARYAERL